MIDNKGYVATVFFSRNTRIGGRNNITRGVIQMKGRGKQVRYSSLVRCG